MQIPLTTKVERYLFQCFRRRSELPDRIPSEQELCERLGVSLIIVRRAIAAMIERKYLIRLPGRKGAFTNPDASLAGKYAIGVIRQGSMGDVQYFGRTILSSFFTELGELPCSVEFFQIENEAYGSLTQTVNDLSLDAVVFFSEDLSITAMDELIRQGFPCVVVLSYYQQTNEFPCGNYVGIDLCELGRQRAGLVESAKQVLYVSKTNATYDAFVQRRKELGMGFPASNHLSGKITEKLNLHLTEKTEAVICDGDYHFLKELFQFMSENPYSHTIPVYANMEVELFSEMSRKYPLLNIFLFPNDQTSLYRKIGRIAAKKMTKMLLSPGYTFPGVLLRHSDEIKPLKQGEKK